MKLLNFLLASLFGLFLISASSCTKESCTTMVTYKKYSPIYKTLDEMNAPVSVMEPQSMKNTGKIFVSGDYLLINEVRKGIHIIDNSTPANPVNVAFISIPGNIDIAFKGNTLFADSYFDMLTFDMTNPNAPTFLTRTEHLYPESKYQYFASRNAYLVGQSEEIVTEEVPCDNTNGLRPQDDAGGVFFSNIKSNSSGSNFGSSGPITIAGSMASMIIMDDYLYIINRREMKIYSATENPILQNTVDVGFGIETLFPNGDKLFIGSKLGMFIYDNSDPLNPVKLSQFMHFRSCDPVFVKDDIAYVTLRDGTPCQGASNQLDVVDVSDLMNPKLIKTYPMFNPHGLSVDDDNLYLCDGADGLKVFGISDLHKITEHLKFRFKDIETYDVIRMPNQELLIVIGNDGLYQFDLSDGIKLLSRITTKN